MGDKRKSVKAGFAEALPLAIAIGAYGLSYGVLATQAHFSWISAVAMSVFVFSGSVQLVTVAMLTSGASLASVLFTSTLLNLRNLLYGAALAEGIAPAKKWRWLLSFGVSDEPFVLGSSRFKKYGPDPLYFAVVAGIFYIVWVMSSLIGALMGNQADPQKWGLDLAFPVTFVALLIPGIREKPAVETALAAVLIALGLEAWRPGNELTIIITGIAAPLVGLYLSRGAQHD
ncbi:AzlC family ABC transporter permease [Parageobacillus thermoglucosidasius]|uniref:AzlC family ABC transporter permease n=1 Tax=Parageobacillus thermoglucosidasius TaxID=1426 RepID=UPI002E210594|nr:AzlC family ABC transporter permease [Parageobacillus thermoglucosidasius]MED4912965.1 AzlC family ABC transporter permease [Parageobacillus thermoglucosidasius]MED4945035.1 AzlC family ABC transporter permease [Parageobacillus thermoglucosidasius]MED4983786.1 AzlC family ABC transporter permease [Parageobacillus thermoglucosidasius]